MWRCSAAWSSERVLSAWIGAHRPAAPAVDGSDGLPQPLSCAMRPALWWCTVEAGSRSGKQARDAGAVDRQPTECSSGAPVSARPTARHKRCRHGRQPARADGTGAHVAARFILISWELWREPAAELFGHSRHSTFARGSLSSAVVEAEQAALKSGRTPLSVPTIRPQVFERHTNLGGPGGPEEYGKRT